MQPSKGGRIRLGLNK